MKAKYKTALKLLTALVICSPIASKAQTTAAVTVYPTSNLQTYKIIGPAGALAAGVNSSYNSGYSANSAISTSENSAALAAVQPANPTASPQAPQPDAAAKKIMDAAAANGGGDSSTKSSSPATINNQQGSQLSAPVFMKLTGHGIAKSSNQILIQSKLITLTGGLDFAAGQQCLTAQKTNWACGDESTTYLQTLLDQGQAVCGVTGNQGSCSVAGDDLAAGMLAWPRLMGYGHIVKVVDTSN